MKLLYVVIKRDSGLNNILHLYGRSKQKHHLIISDFYPYFFIQTTELPKLETLRSGIFNQAEDRKYSQLVGYIRSIRDGYESLFEEDLTKIEMQVPWQVGKLRRFFSKSYEADIIFERRFLIDHGVKKGFEVRRRDMRDGEQVPHREVKGF